MRLKKSLKLQLLSCCLLLLSYFSNVQGKEAVFDVKAHYDKAEYMIPMSDGIRLFTIVYTPNDKSQKYPILLYRTPYSVRYYGADNYHPLLGPSAEFDRDGFIFVFQDGRGKFKSEGEFQVIKPPITDKKSNQDVDESSDTYDTIEWLLKNIPSHNGRAGQWGISFSGWETFQGMIEAHPALKAFSPQASPSDMFIGDDWHHNGAFRLMSKKTLVFGSGRYMNNFPALLL